MKKIVCLLLLVSMAACMFVSCGSKFTCDWCEEEKSGKKYTEEIMGEEVTICGDCYDQLEALGSLLG